VLDQNDEDEEREAEDQVTDAEGERQ